MSVPRDFLEEIDRELTESVRLLAHESSRLAQLVELHRRALATSLQWGRMVSIVDVVGGAKGEDERRIVELVRALRGRDDE